MKKIGTFIFFLSLCPLWLWGQGEASNWYFGNNAGLQFNNNGSVTALEGGQLETFEGCATISDIYGELLFYTDGITVYDQRNEIMLNGTGLYGDPSSTQSALIVPAPEDTNLYYIFTVDTSVGPDDPDFGLNYSIVNITENNGYGAVVEKNINILRDCTEKISAVLKDCADNSIWVLTLGPENGVGGVFNTFFAFEVSPTGVDPNPVRTTFSTLSIEDPRGYLKLSADGTKIVSANVVDGAFLYDFDASTGIVTNQQELEISSPGRLSYGVEFSPSGEFLYVHSYGVPEKEKGNISKLIQFDLGADDISASGFIIDESPIFRGALQLGNNGKIYRTITKNYFDGTQFLGVIENPNERGYGSTYRHNAIELEGEAMQGLPPFIQSFFRKEPLALNPDGTKTSNMNVCIEDTFRLEATEIAGASYFWYRNGIPIDGTTNFIEITDATVEDSGRYTLEIIPPDTNECIVEGEGLVNVLERPEPILQLTACDIDEENSLDGLTRINLEELNNDPTIQFTFYESIEDRDMEEAIEDSMNYYNTVPFTQTIYYRGINTEGCEYLGEVNLNITEVAVTPSSHGPFVSCDEIADDDLLLGTFELDAIASYYEGEDLLFYESLSDLANGQNEILQDYVSEPTNIYILRKANAQCVGIDVLDLQVTVSPKLQFEDTYTLCKNGVLQVDAPEGFNSYQWYLEKNGQEVLVSETASISIEEVGTYVLDTQFVYEINGEEILCENSASFEVVLSSTAKVDNVDIVDFSTNNSIEVHVSGDGEYLYSLDGVSYQEENIFTSLAAGIYTLRIKDIYGCGITEKEVAVMGYPTFFTPNGDGINDYWKITGLTEQFESDAVVAIFDRYGKIITQLLPSTPGWDGRLNNQALPASDYWFTIRFQDGRKINGHFALKR